MTKVAYAASQITFIILYIEQDRMEKRERQRA
jgi:hypothetical protein